MKWLVQEFLNAPSNIIRVTKTLDKHSISYLLVRVNKDNSLTVLDKQTKLPLGYSKGVLQEFIRDEQIMIYGSKTFAKIAEDMKLNPGSFMNANFEFDVFKRELGNDLLNHEIIIDELSTLKPIAEEFFIRPTGNTKLFTGMTVTREEFLDWQQRENRADSPYIGQSLMIAPIQNIKAEYRFFIVNQQVITGSSYKVNNKLDISRKPSTEIIEYTKQMVAKFPLAKAFVIDIAETDKGLKIVEYNNINTSGLYGCDEEAFILAINSLNELR